MMVIFFPFKKLTIFLVPDCQSVDVCKSETS